MSPNQALWEKGDFTAIAGFMRESGEAIVESLRVVPPLRALDLGCGDGTTAVPLAHTGAEVTGIDIARNLVDAGKKRARQAGLSRLKFQEGDACSEIRVLCQSQGRRSIGCVHRRPFREDGHRCRNAKEDDLPEPGL